MCTQPIGESNFGFVFTNGDPTGRSKNTLAGADLQYRELNFRPGEILGRFLLRAQHVGHQRRRQFLRRGAQSSEFEPFGLETRFKQLGTNYFPALGFVNRTGIRQGDGIATYRRRDLGWHWLDVATSCMPSPISAIVWSRARPESDGDFSLRSTDEFYLRAFDDYEDVTAPFKIAGKLPVPSGQYHWTNGSIYIQTASNSRAIFGRLDVLCCSYYNGHQVKAALQLDMRPNATFQLTPKYTYTYLDLPGGLLNIHALSLALITNFTPDMQLYTEMQYDKRQ